MAPSSRGVWAAALEAQVGSYGQLVELTERVGDLDRAEALRQAEAAAREEREAQERSKVVRDAVDELPTQPVQVDAPGPEIQPDLRVGGWDVGDHESWGADRAPVPRHLPELQRAERQGHR